MAKFFKFIFKWSIIAAAWLSVLLALILFYYYRDLPTLEELESSKSKQIIQINYSNDNKLVVLGDLYDSKITYNEIPKHLVDAVIATEDRRFFQHRGVDIFGIVRALYIDYRAKKMVQGGSTITQQLTKLLFLKPEKTIKRKIQEILLAVKMERAFSKEQILTLYLNRAYFGAGNYGIASASKYYFNKPVSKINLNESAMLAGLLKAPSKLSPSKHQNLAENRANQVLSNMVDAGYLRDHNIKDLDQKINYQADKLQKFYFANYAAGKLWEFISKEDQEDSYHFTAKTTLDEEIQNVTENVVDKFILQNKKKMEKSQIAVIVMKKDGAILAMIGGKDYQKSPFNRAVYSKRQPGSAFKTFVYLTAFEKGLKPEDKIEDKKINIGKWSPENSDKKYYGLVSLKTAFALSLNSASVQLAGKIDRSEIIKTAQRLGITSPIDKDDPTIALGTMQVSLLELVSSYGAIANDGYVSEPYSIQNITDYQGDVLYQHQSLGAEKIITPENLVMIKEILREVVEKGTGKNANVAKNIYGKTGTSQNSRDAWFIGFDDNYIIGVWIGNDDNSPTDKINGGSLPAFLFGDIIRKIG